MKSKKNQRLLALILSMVLMLSASISAMAEGEMQTEASGTEVIQNQAEEQSLEDEASAASYSGETEVQESSAETGEEITPAESGETVQSESVSNGEQQSSETVTENGQITEETVEPQTDEAQPQAEETVIEQPAETPEEILPEEVISEAAELKQKFTDEKGNVTQTVTAYVPEGAFQARADQISMNVSLLNAEDTNYIKGMTEELLPENHYLDGYVFYQIDFMVDGQITEPARAITISMKGNELEVEDTEKAHVFYYVPEDPEIEGDKDQLTEVIQKDQLLRSLEEAGENTGNIEDYDYSQIAVQDGKAETITVKGWKSTIYGCYVEKEKEPVTLEGTAEDIHVTLAGPASSFPDEGELTLSVKEVNKKTDKLAEKAVEEQAEKEDLEVLDYTALDITILKDGEEIQPLGPVNVTFTKEEKEKSKDAKPDQIKVFHVDEETGKAQDMEATESEEGKVEIETDHFSIYVVVDLDQLGGQIDLTVQHWATVNQLDGVDGTDGLIESAGPNGKPGDATAALRSKDVFTNIYTDDVIKLDNKLNKNVEELSKVLLADANSEIKNYELKEIWVLKDNQTPGTNTIDKTDTNAYNTEKNKWTVYSLDDTDKTVKLTKNSTIRMIYEPVEANNAFSQNVTFYDYDVTDGKRYNANGQEDPNGNYLNTTDKGINSDSNYNGGNENNRLAVGMNSTWVDHKYHNAKSNNGNGVVLNWSGGQADDAKKGIVTGINADGPIYNGVAAPQLFNDTPQVGKTVIDGYQLHFSQVGDTYTLSSVTNASGGTVLSKLETLTEIWDGITNNKPRHIFSNNFWPLDGESHPNQDPLLGGSTAYKVKKVHTNVGTKDVSASDDGQAHNWLFGMRYSFEFTLGDYTGPLNFYFRGDDDFWLFVDGQLQTDLGGIHSSVGANLDMSKCIDTSNREATHKIDIIYTERGCFGSTCYMQFTLPNVKSVEFDTETPKTSITVNKVWQDHNNPNRPASIDVELYYRVKGSTGEWTKYDTQTLSTANNWTYTWHNMPKDGYEYRVHEVGEKDGKFGNYITAYSEDGGLLTKNLNDGTFSGTITNSSSPSTYITVNKAWDDGNNANNSRPDSVDFYLYYRNQANTEWIQYPNGKLTLTADGNWTGTYDNLPVYWGDTNQKMIYTVMEINGNDPLSNGGKLPGELSFEYTVSYPEDHIGDDGFGKGYKAKTDDTETPQETLNLTVTNSLGVSIKVNKVWKGHDPGNDTVIYVGLYQAGKRVEDKWVELKADNNWTATFQYLTPAKDYSVKELRKAGSDEAAEFTIGTVGYVGVNSGQETTVGNIKYDVSYGALTQDTSDMSLSTVTITNQAKWQLIKYSSSSEDKTLILEGAEFELKNNDDNTVYKGVSDKNGIVNWKIGDTEFTDVFLNGTYTLTETAAPTGYMLGKPVTFEMKDGVPVKMDDENAVIKDGILTFYYANEAIYSLPSSGSSGIYGYLLGGMLLMMAASLIVYKTKRGEVLKRK